MRTYLVRRFLYSLVSLFLLSVTIFTLIRVTGGDPALLIVGPGGAPDDIERTRQQWGLDRPWPEQYVKWATNMLRGDFGTSFQYRVSVRSLYFERLPNSLRLAVTGLILSLLIGIPAGIISAIKVDSGWDTVAGIIAMLGLSVPGFFIGLVMILVFAVWARLLPAAGANSWKSIIMPSVALGWYFAASMLRLTRSSMLEVLDSEFVKLARLKGLPERMVIAKHAFRNALIPVLTLAGVNLVVMVNVAVVVETVFAWPGIGRLLFESISLRDFPLTQGIVIMAGVMIITVNLLVDILYAWVDPRIRYA